MEAQELEFNRPNGGQPLGPMMAGIVETGAERVTVT